MTAIEKLEKEFELLNSRTPKPKNYFPKKGGGGLAKYSTSPRKIFKQVVIKTIGQGLNNIGTKKVLEYVARGADTLELEDEKGEKKTIDEIYKDWKQNFSVAKNPETGRVPKEALHLVFSIDEEVNQKNLEALEQSVRDVLKINLYEYRYAMVVHTHQNRPHVHVILNKRSTITGKKLTFKSRKECKDFFTQLREDFKENLNYYNKEFSYENRFKVDRNLELALLAEYFQKVNKENYLFKEFVRESQRSVARLGQKQNEVGTKIVQTLQEIKSSAALSFSLLKGSDQYSIQKAATTLNTLKRKQEFFAKREEEQSLLLKISKEAVEKIKPSELAQKIKMLEYLEMPQQKKLLTRKQRQALASLHRSLDFTKLNYTRQLDETLNKEESDLEKMVKKTNAFALMKHLRQLDERMAMTEILQDETHMERLVKNHDFVLSAMEKRYLRNKNTIAFLKDKLQTETKQTEREEIKKALAFLQSEAKIMHERFNPQVKHSLELEKEIEAQKISKKLDIEFDNSQSIDAFLLEHRPAYIAKRQEELEKYAARMAKELKLEGWLELMSVKEFVDKYNPRYKYHQNLIRAQKIVKRLKLEDKPELMSTDGLGEFLKKYKEEYDKIVREGIEKFVQKIADEHGMEKPSDMEKRSNQELFEWIEVNNVCSPSRQLLGKYAEKQLEELIPKFEIQREKWENIAKENEPMPKELERKKLRIDNLENILKKTESITPIFENDIKFLDEHLVKILAPKEKTIKKIPITIEGTPYTHELVNLMKETIPKLEISGIQAKKIEAYLHFLSLSEEKEPISKSYLKKHGFLNQKGFEKIEFEPFEKMAPSVKMPAIEEALTKEMRAKNIVLERAIKREERAQGISR
ncbi:relaxase/mobilization nuclease domain-containing protein [Sulfurospirillum sp. T05]|uniref:Relaxase/mobilization nuclease domain-containing protein n=1 Tax=Sulfurospirillum tamanense TaxID=2813362 RepID=A0ABS2WUF0_9BACT|nr:relaxase/mobilization nuclease domain-containing protein [Sulfurospirillum tamanensis]MBN2965271.1 relaxase/mobilization nuclease domain-containing protein [Sulfurospirillum tamanensis]